MTEGDLTVERSRCDFCHRPCVVAARVEQDGTIRICGYCAATACVVLAEPERHPDAIDLVDPFDAPFVEHVLSRGNG